MSDVLQGELILQFQQAIAQLQSASRNTEKLTASLNKAGVAATGMQAKLRAAGAAAAGATAGAAGAAAGIDPFRAMVDRQKVSVLAAQERVRAYKQAHQELGLSMGRSADMGRVFSSRMREQMSSMIVGTIGLMTVVNAVGRAISAQAVRVRESGKEGSDFARKTQEIMIDTPALRRSLNQSAPALTSDEGITAAKAYVAAGGKTAEPAMRRMAGVTSMAQAMGWGVESTAKTYADLQRRKVERPEDWMALYFQEKGPVALAAAATDKKHMAELMRTGRKAGPAAEGAFGRAIEAQPRESMDYLEWQRRSLQGRLERKQRTDTGALANVVAELAAKVGAYGEPSMEDILGEGYKDWMLPMRGGKEERLPMLRMVAALRGKKQIDYGKLDESEREQMRMQVIASPKLQQRLPVKIQESIQRDVFSHETPGLWETITDQALGRKRKQALISKENWPNTVQPAIDKALNEGLFPELTGPQGEEQAQAALLGTPMTQRPSRAETPTPETALAPPEPERHARARAETPTQGTPVTQRQPRAETPPPETALALPEPERHARARAETPTQGTPVTQRPPRAAFDPLTVEISPQSPRPAVAGPDPIGAGIAQATQSAILMLGQKMVDAIRAEGAAQARRDQALIRAQRAPRPLATGE